MKIQKILASFASVAGLVACATAERAAEPTPPTITLEEAREFQNGVLLDLAEYLPDGSVVGGFEAPIPKMHGMTCDWARGSLASPAAMLIMAPSSSSCTSLMAPQAAKTLSASELNRAISAGSRNSRLAPMRGSMGRMI